jgi:hypothetical protein
MVYTVTLADTWAGGMGSGRYFLPPNKFSVHCILCHIAPLCNFCCVLHHSFSYDSSLIFARIIIILYFSKNILLLG